MSEGHPRRFERPLLQRTAPNRGAGNFYRAATGDRRATGGVPLDSVEAAVVAAVRTGYKIAEAQIDRSGRLARRLRQAGDRAAGPGSDRQALDATEQILFRAMMSGLSWFEGFADDRGNPLKRVASAQYRILGSLLGLAPAEEPTARHAEPDRFSSDARAPEVEPARPTAQASRKPTRVESPPQIRHAGSVRRPVRVRNWEIAAQTAPGDYPLVFYGPETDAGTIEGVLALRARRFATLTLETRLDTERGVWNAAICDEQGIQVGWIEIEL